MSNYCEESMAAKVEEMRTREMRLARTRKLLKAKIEPIRNELMRVETELNKLETDRLAIERLLIKPKKVQKVDRRTEKRRFVDKQTAELLSIVKGMSKEQLTALQDLAMED